MSKPELVDNGTLAIMATRGGEWAAYENQAFDSANFGHRKFLAFGEGCTFVTPPERLPDTESQINWRYWLVGVVDLATGEIHPYARPA